MKRTVFADFHPAVAALYFAFVIIYCMAAFHPVLVALSLVTGLAANAYLRGREAAARTASWQIPLLVVIALANPLFSASGTTLLFVVGPFPIYGESFAYGLCMGAMLVASMLWISNAAAIMTSENVMLLTGRRMPVVGLMASMVTRLVPQFVRRGRLVASAADATTARSRCSQDSRSSARPSRISLAERVRHISVLMGWSMEDSLDMADAMRARGWGAQTRRTTYQRRSLGVVDVSLLVFLGAVMACVAAITVVACAGASFYPVISMGQWWWLAAVGYAIVLAIPGVMEVHEWLKWR